MFFCQTFQSAFVVLVSVMLSICHIDFALSVYLKNANERVWGGSVCTYFPDLFRY